MPFSRQKTKSVRLAVEFKTRQDEIVVVPPHKVCFLRAHGSDTKTEVHFPNTKVVVDGHIDTIKDELGIAVTNK